VLRKADQPRALEINSAASGSAVTASDRRLSIVPIVILLSLAALMVIGRLGTYGKPLDRDLMTYSVMGHELLAGRSLYSDLWEQKPPTIYITYAVAEILTGYGPHTIFLLGVVMSIITLLGVYFAGSASSGGMTAGLWAAAFWAIISNNLELDAGSPNTEVFMNACLIWAFALLVRMDGRSSGLWRSLAIGALFALASSYKTIVVAIPVLLACVHVAFPPAGSPGRRRALGQVLVMAAVSIGAWVLVFSYFAVTGRFEAFREVFIYNRYYAGGLKNMIVNLLAPVRRTSQLIPNFLNPLAILTSVGAVFGILKSVRFGALLSAFIIATWIGIALPGGFWPHYYQLWLPPLAVGAGWAVGLLAKVTAVRRFAWLPHVAGAVVLAILIVQELPWYRRALAGDWSEIVASPRFAAADRFAPQIEEILAPDETFYVWGDSPALYFWTRRHPPTRYLLTTHIIGFMPWRYLSTMETMGGPLADAFSARVAADLAREQPELFIVERAPLGLAQPEVFDISRDKEQPEIIVNKAGHPVIDWFAEHYRPFPNNPDRGYYVLFMRRGGKLEARMEAAVNKNQTQ
jgi:hypothetical protein